MELKVEYLPIDALKPYEKNARKHQKEDVKAIEESIREFGFLDPIGIWGEENIIVEGHGRLQAAKNLGIETVPVIRLDELTDEQRRAYALAHNKTAELSEWDLGFLDEELRDLFGSFDMGRFGFEIPSGNECTDNIDDVQEVDAPDQVEARCKAGQLWQLGDHRLICGDSTDEKVIAALMDGAKADMVFTDPPYGVAIGSKNNMLNEHDKAGRNQEKLQNDEITPSELYPILVKAMTNVRLNSKPDCSYYVSSPQGGDLGMMMMMMMQEAGLKVRHILIWVKNVATFSMGRLDYDYRHEPIFYTWTEKHNFYGGYSNTVIDDTTPIDKMSKSELKDLVRAMTEKKEDSVIYCDKPLKCDLHPTMKPIKLIARFIINSSKQGDNVIDIFGGSGSTLIACEQLKRKCFTVELDPHYCDVIIQRWEDFTGRKAVLLND